MSDRLKEIRELVEDCQELRNDEAVELLTMIDERDRRITGERVMSDCTCTTGNDVHAVYCPEYKYAWRDKRIEELETGITKLIARYEGEDAEFLGADDCAVDLRSILTEHSLSECGYIDCCPVNELKQRIEELEARYKETLHLLASTGVALNKAEAQLAIHEASIQGRVDCFAKLKAAEAQLERVRGLQSYSVTFVDQKTRLRITRQVVDADKLQAILEKDDG